MSTIRESHRIVIPSDRPKPGSGEERRPRAAPGITNSGIDADAIAVTPACRSSDGRAHYELCLQRRNRPACGPRAQRRHDRMNSTGDTGPRERQREAERCAHMLEVIFLDLCEVALTGTDHRHFAFAWIGGGFVMPSA